MPPPTLPAIRVSATSTEIGTPRTLGPKPLGDGYAAVAKRGLNNLPRRYRAVWQMLLASEAEQLIDFFEARGGAETFLFQPPDFTAAVEWRCPTWQRLIEEDDVTRRGVEAEFEEAF